MKDNTSFKYIAFGLGVVILAIGLRTLLWQEFHANAQMMPDSQSYIAPAQSLLNNRTFLNSGGHVDTIRTPGYPLLIALVYHAQGTLNWVMIVQQGMILGMAFLIAGSIAKKDTNASLLTAGLILLSPLLFFYADFILSDILFTFLICCLFSLLSTAASLKSPTFSIVCSACIAGAATLVRPIGLFIALPVVLYILLCLPRQRVKQALVFILLFTIIPAAWMIRNHHESGQYTLSTISDINILGYQAAGTLAIKDGGNYAIRQEDFKQQLFAQAESQVAASGEPKSHVYREMGIQIIKENPIPFCKHVLKLSAMTLFGYGSSHIAQLTGLPTKYARYIALSITIPFILLALYGLAQAWKNHRHLAVLSFLFIGYFVGIAAVAGVGGSRFRLPVEPILCLLCALGIAALHTKRRKTHHF